MIIKNIDTFQENGKFVCKDIYIEGERFVENADGEVVEFDNCYAIPGLVDIHFHGCMGVDFCNGTHESIAKIAEYELDNGVMAICPASMTLSEEQLSSIFESAASYKNDKGADLVGINMEGPFISMEKKGAQNPKYIASPDIEFFNRLQEKANGLIKIVDIAVENEETFKFIDALHDKVCISIAHTTAGYEYSKKAFKLGARNLTHMFNAMNGLNHRDPGPIGAAFDNPNVRVELIADGIHISPTVIRIAFKLFGEDRVMLISDSMEATGMQDGEYSLGGQKVIKKGRRATLESGTIAGSASNLYECMVNAVKNMDIPLEIAVKSASVNPAKQIGIYDNYGSIDTGKYANLVIIDKDTLEIKQLIFKGKLL